MQGLVRSLVERLNRRRAALAGAGAADPSPDLAAAAHPEAVGHFEQAEALERSGDLAAALDGYERAALLAPGFVPATSACARLCAALGRPADALRWARHWSDAAPDDWQAELLKGQLLAATGRHADGMDALGKAMAASNGHPLVWHARGNALFGADRIEDAAAAYERALGAMPGLTEAQVNCGVCWHRLGNPARALGYFDAALRQRSDHPQALYNRTLALIDLHRLDEAMASAVAARALQPADANIDWSHAIAHLTAGRWAEGWPGLESRWQATALGATVSRHQFDQPRWRGESLQGKTILVHAEQGLGDTLQFVRYVPLLEKRGGRVLLWVPQALQELLATVSPTCHVGTHIQQMPAFDCECPLMSLPGAFQTGLENVPAQVPYLHADAARRSQWEALLGQRTRLRVGLAWSGSGAHRNHRSVPLPMLGGLLALDCDFISVQKELSDQDLADVKQQGRVRHFGERLQSMADTAALLDCMDLVVSVDTSVAHLAGALGRPLCVMLPFRSDWRWLQGRDDSPWYPSARLYRQEAAGKWEPVLAGVEAAVGHALAQGAAAWPPPRAAVHGEAPASPDEWRQAQQWVAEGNRLEDAGDLEGACALYRQAAHAAPTFPGAHLNLGIGLAAQGDLAGAARAYQAALALDPAHAFANYNFANLAFTQGDLAGAEALVRRALASKAGFAQAHVLLSNILDAKGDAQAAAQALQDAILAEPGYAGAHYNLAMLMRRLERPADALAAALRAAAAEPGNADAQALLASIQIEQGLALEALEPLRQAIALAPQNLELRSRELFLMNLDEGVGATALFQKHRALGSLLERAPARFQGAWPASREPARRLRVGYVSGDFRVHPVSLFLLPVLERRDRTQFEVVCYSRGAAQDHITARIRDLSDRWVDSSTLGMDELGAAIHADRIDVLVDLLGHSGDYTVPVYAQSAAPVQATWLGYLNTTGLTRMNYRVSDTRADPPAASAPLHTEQLVAMPFSQWCYRPFVEVDAPGPTPHEKNGHITFGSFNQAAKVSSTMCRRWAAILRRVPGSRLLLAGISAPAKQEAVTAVMQAEGVEAARIEFAPRVHLQEYFELLATVDIALDTYPYGGGTTTFDALWMGVPVLTVAGDTPGSRSAASILAPLGLASWVAGSIDDYEQLAVERASDRSAIAELRATLRATLRDSRFMDEETFTRDLESVFRHMWERYCAAPPAAAGALR